MKIIRKKNGKPKFTRTEKVARGVSGKNVQLKDQVMSNISFDGQTVEVKDYLLNHTSDLFGIDWMALFNQWDSSINSFCN